MIRRMLRRARAEEGMTIIELIVAMAVGALVLSVVGLFVVNISKATVSSAQTRLSVGYAADDLNAITRVLSTATTVTSSSTTPSNEIVAACNESLSIYSYTMNSIPTPTPSPTALVNFAPTEYAFSLSAGRQLVIAQYPGTIAATGIVSFPNTPSSTRTLSGVIVSPTGGQSQLFQYISSSGSVLPMTNGCLPTASYGYVAQIQVTVNMSSANLNAGTNTVTQLVELANIVPTGVAS